MPGNPLLCYLIVGAALFALEPVFPGRPSDESTVVEISPATRVLIAERLRYRFGREPTGAELDGAIRTYVDDEILVREGLKLGLHLSDEVIRRRLVQIMGFVTEGSGNLALPSDDELSRYFADHLADYSLPERVSGQHVFFSRDRHADEAPMMAAETLRAGRRGEEISGAGDPSVETARFSGRSPAELGRGYGAEFGALAATAPLGVWTGPVESAFGTHIVRIDQRTEGNVPEFGQVRERVLADYLAERRDTERSAALERLRKVYTVRIE
jgi:hypothetical protein